MFDVILQTKKNITQTIALICQNLLWLSCEKKLFFFLLSQRKLFVCVFCFEQIMSGALVSDSNNCNPWSSQENRMHQQRINTETNKFRPTALSYHPRSLENSAGQSPEEGVTTKRNNNKCIASSFGTENGTRPELWH